MVVNLVDSAFLEIGSVDCLGIVIGNTGGLAGPSYRVVFVVDEAHEFSSLLIRHLHVLAHH